MTKATLSLEHNVLFPKTQQEHPPLLVLLHGYGSDENDLFSFADELNQKFLVISLKAPIALSFGGNAWYEINYQADATKWTNVPQALEAKALIIKSINEAQKAYGTAVNQTYLLGFSQGAILSYAISLSHPKVAQNILALSGYVDTQLLPDVLAENELQNLDYFVSHGSVDEVIPVDWARKSKQFLTENNLSFSYKEYNMGHGINPECFKDLQDWLTSKQML